MNRRMAPFIGAIILDLHDYGSLYVIIPFVVKKIKNMEQKQVGQPVYLLTERIRRERMR